MRLATTWAAVAWVFLPTSCTIAFASQSLVDALGRVNRAGVGNGIRTVDRPFGEGIRGGAVSTKAYSSTVSKTEEASVSLLQAGEESNRPLRVLFLSADTGGGHRASAEALAAQFLLQFPGSYYELADLWTDHGVLPYKRLVPTYKHLSSHPNQWRLFYHLSNTKLNEVLANIHSKITCGKRIKDRIEAFDPDVVVSVHPTMNHTPLLQVQKISKQSGKHIPFFTVVTDLGSGHTMWFERNVNKLYVASDRLYKLARRRGGTPQENIVMTGLPIRHGFAVEAEKLGDRTTEAGKEYQQQVRKELGIKTDKQMVLVMGGGEGVGSLSDIVNELYVKLTRQGVDATICVVCGRNERLKADLATRDWDTVFEKSPAKKSRKGRNDPKRALRSKAISDAYVRAEQMEATTSNGDSTSQGYGNVEVVGLGFIKNMPEYMVAADVLVTKAGPGTIAEAASVGLPVMLTSFLPGQEAGNVDVVLESGYGDYCETPSDIGRLVGYWLQDHDLLSTMSTAAARAGNPYAADEIVHDIGTQTVAWMNLNEQ